jgi:hypothetical protein
MIRSAALLCMVLSLVAIGCAYASAFIRGGAPGWAAWAMAIGTSALLVSLMALGAMRRGRLGWLWIPIGFTFVVLAGGFCLALSMDPAAADSDLWLGLPAAAAVVLYGVGILPFLAVPAAYALGFDEMTLSEADLARVAAAMASREADGEAGAPPGRAG